MASARMRNLAKLSSLATLPPEIRRKAFDECQLYLVHIADQNQLCAADIFSKFNLEPEVAHDYACSYCRKTVFVLRAHDLYADHGASYIDQWRDWVSKIDPAYAGMIQHIRIKTPAFEAKVHIPVDQTEPLTVVFNHQEKNCVKKLATFIRDFNKKLQRVNIKLERSENSRAGQRLTAEDLKYLGEKIFHTVQFCCKEASKDA